MVVFTRILVGLVALVAALAAGSYLIPSHITVSRSIEIAASPEEVFPHINSLQAFAEWSPWGDRDPEMEQTFSGPEAGVGNRMEWNSDHPQVGSGSQEIVGSAENARVETALDFGDMGEANAAFVLQPAGDGTRVIWGFQTDMGMNPIARYMGLMMDSWIGADYEAGLANLKARVEGSG